MYYVAVPSNKGAHIAMHYIFNAGNGNWIPTRNTVRASIHDINLLLRIP